MNIKRLGWVLVREVTCPICVYLRLTIAIVDLYPIQKTSHQHLIDKLHDLSLDIGTNEVFIEKAEKENEEYQKSFQLIEGELKRRGVKYE